MFPDSCQLPLLPNLSPQTPHAVIAPIAHDDDDDEVLLVLGSAA